MQPHGEMPFATIATPKLSGLICPITWTLYPEVQLLALLRTMFGRKGTPFIYPIVYNFVSL